MDFYESARFQYAAARLLVKLAQFRKTGTFQQKITRSSNIGIELIDHTRGSFNINIEAPSQSEDNKQFAKLSLSDMLAYVSERVIEKVDETDISSSGGQISDSLAARSVDQTDIRAEAELRTGGAVIQLTDIPRRRLAETNREQRLISRSAAIAKIDPSRALKLTSMAAPLLSEMATALRRSADSLEIYDSLDKKENTILFLDRKMAAEIETAKVDRDITTILGDIVQFNKDNGWGKLRIENGARIVNFSIPSDLLPNLKHRFIRDMGTDKVYLQAYFVRDAGREIVRLIVVGVLQLPEN
ncbi:hypothetical protein NFI95_07565 [Acetobacteraceae bacterium KSS8]|uniref:Uncharacterized protein n=1 Tax=Endosaccharibacter trunci TaxID=2812733 RepID=A0ABT1W5Y8_9PROT|nr:hypothetical protein [Acetobacteraceae bacterium KSS8]